LRMSRRGRPFFQLFFLLALFLLHALARMSPSPPRERSSKDRLNVLLVTIDTLRADRLGCYREEGPSLTPNVDALAARSLLFTRAFAHTTTTLPSHVNILLGTTPLRHGVHNNAYFTVREKHLTLAEHLKEAGYATAAFVGAFPLDSRFGLSQGFDTYDESFGFTTSEGEAAVERRAESVIREGLEWLEQTRFPWFLWLHCYDPHDPYEPPEPFRSEYTRNPYDGEVAYVDHALGRLFRYLEERALMNRTLIVFTGDHGESLGEHEEITHGYLAYNTTLWVPLLIYVPGWKPRTISQNVAHVDLFPTVCDILGVERPSSLEGISLVGAMKGKKIGKRSIYFESLLPYYDLGWAPIRGIINDRFKFIESPLPELYDLRQDFQERQNLARADNLGAYRKQLERIMKNADAEEERKAKTTLDGDAIRRLRSLGYIGDTFGRKSGAFTEADDVKTLLPFHNRAAVAFRLWKEGKREVGIRILEDILRRKKKISSAYSNLGSIYRSEGKGEDALRVLKAGRESIPESYKVFSEYLDCLAEAGREEELIREFQASAFPQLEFDPVVWNLVGVAYLNIGDLEQARKHCERAVSIDPTFALSFSNLGGVHFRAFSLTTNPGELEEALRNYKKALELDSGLAAAHDGLGLIYMYREDYEKAIRHLETVLRTRPDTNHALYNLGIAYLKTGKKKKALSCFHRFKITPSYTRFSSSEKEKLERYILLCKEAPFPE